ncbi:hypothetical protein SPLC1_S201310 [Arthrospira platensis C1]|uniref:Uncharacterized protein n=1 Tax=Limnospira indica PCC 8005 TaxID=376219 RepID=A0A9P1P1X4_9CYAN|nr:hypothetical protein SPLC1_S201310 [Arthrospira platensis C1]CDM98293.1 conserved protein of unknown function [Limnospira indica PCC 8005]
MAIAFSLRFSLPLCMADPPIPTTKKQYQSSHKKVLTSQPGG